MGGAVVTWDESVAAFQVHHKDRYVGIVGEISGSWFASLFDSMRLCHVYTGGMYRCQADAILALGVRS